MQILYYVLMSFKLFFFCTKSQAWLHWEAGVAVVFETFCCYVGWETQAGGGGRAGAGREGCPGWGIL